MSKMANKRKKRREEKRREKGKEKNAASSSNLQNHVKALQKPSTLGSIKDPTSAQQKTLATK